MDLSITPLKIATLTRELFGTPEAVVIAVLGAFPQYNAIEMRTLLLNSSVYPALSSAEVNQALQAGGLTPVTEFLAIYSQFTTTNTTEGKQIGQSFTIGSEGGYLTRIITNSLGGASGQQLLNGIANSTINIREYVNDIETGTKNALSGKVLTSKGSPTVLNYDYGAYYPSIEFLFDGSLSLKSNTKYVMEFVLGRGIAAYIKIDEPYNGGQGYDIDGINLNYKRNYPFSLFLS